MCVCVCRHVPLFIQYLVLQVKILYLMTIDRLEGVLYPTEIFRISWRSCHAVRDDLHKCENRVHISDNLTDGRESPPDPRDSINYCLAGFSASMIEQDVNNRVCMYVCMYVCIT